MTKFVDINSLTEKTLDGSESVQVSDTQKSKLVNILTQLGKNLQMAVNGSDSWQLPNFDTNSTPVQNWLNALAFACGLRDESTGWGPFRIINGNDGDIAYFVILWYDNINNLTEAFVIGSYANAVVTLYEKSGKQHLTSSDNQDNAVIQDIISTGGWTKVATINADSNTIKQTYGTNTKFLAPVQGSETLLTTTIERILYALGFRGTNSCFRQLIASYVTGGTDSQVQCYYGVTWYNGYYERTYTMLVNMERANGKYITLYRKQGRHIESNPTDDAYVTDVLTGDWLKVADIGTGGSEPTPIESLAAEKVLVEAPTLFDENTSSTWDPTAANNLQELVNGLLYRIGVRITPDGLNLGFRVAQANDKIAIIANDQSSSDYSVFLFSGGSVIHTYLIDQNYVMEWIGNYSSDSDIIASIESDGIETGMLDLAGINNFATKAYVKPNDAVLTMFPSGYRTVIPGENLTTNLTSGTLKIKVSDLLTAQVKNGPFRDAVIDVPYGVTVQFADQVGIVYKADGVDGFTATSGRKVYTIHFVPTTSSTINITFRAFVNVTNYK